MMIELNQVRRDYSLGQSVVAALDSVDLQIAAGESVALLGPSGSGKSTLLQILGCLDQPSAGSYRLDGVTVAGLDRNQLAAFRCEKVGFVFQRFHLMPRMTAEQNVMLPMRFAGLAPAKQRERARELLDRVGLADRAKHRPSELSGGQQQRVAVARALANQPRILLADEPTGNLDSVSGKEVLALLLELHASGMTLIVVTHDEELAKGMQRIVRLHDGKIQAE
jgi:ABC-type lipoprotein export system ATPase subunit